MFALIIKLISKIFLFTGRLGGKNSFDKKLTKEEETRLFSAYLETRSKEVEEKLTRSNLRLVAHIANKYKKCTADEDDLISVGSIGLIKAIRSFDPQKTKNFSTYASRCIENELLMMIRAEKKRKGDVYLEDSIGIDKDGAEISLIDILESSVSDVERNAEIKSDFKKVERIINTKLTPREKEIIAHRFGLFGQIPKTQMELARQMNISRSYISRLEKHAIDVLRSNINKNS